MATATTNVTWTYPVDLVPDDNGTILVTFPDVPEAHTFGEGEADALRQAEDALVTALAGYIAAGRRLPLPSDVRDGARSVVVPIAVAAKLELCAAMQAGGWNKAQLAKALHLFPAQVDRLVNLLYPTRIETVQAALKTLGRTVVMHGAGLRPGVVLPAMVLPGGRQRSPRSERRTLSSRAKTAKPRGLKRVAR